jgi:hypothetical protein
MDHKTLPVEFHNTLDSALKSRLVDISKLICEVWLGEARGVKFKNAIKSRRDVKDALNDCGITFPENYVRFQLDTSSYNGSIEIEEDLRKGLTFLWNLPYAPRPAFGITEAEVKEWIAKCDEWMASGTPSQDFPVPDNVYIPLATF